LKICSRCGDEKPLEGFPKQAKVCKICTNAKAREVYHSNLEESRAKRRVIENRNYDTTKRREKARRWRARYPEKVAANNKKNQKWRNEWRKEWLKTKPGYMTPYSNARRDHIKRATPFWVKADKNHLKQIAEVYKSCKTRSIFHEERFEVDHIEPLRGKTSCGLHVFWNLQILTAFENNSKNNKLIVQPT